MTPVDAVPPAADAKDLDLVTRSTANVMVTAREAAVRVAWARWIRERGTRRHGPFVAVRVGTNQLVRAADVDEWFARAAGGTLFIDCVGHLSADAQTRLSARLSEPSRRITDLAALNDDDRVRVITGTNRPLQAEGVAGAFDDTLFYRLNVIHIQPLPDEAGEHRMKARELMSQPPFTCGPNTDLATVAKIMWDHDCGFVPVVDAAGAVTGAVTDRDICIATSTRRLLPEHISAAQAMTSPIHACLPDDEISDVLATMRQCRIRRVPVINASGRLQGVISLNDIVLATTNKQEPRASEVISTLAAICAHRRSAAAVA